MLTRKNLSNLVDVSAEILLHYAKGVEASPIKSILSAHQKICLTRILRTNFPVALIGIHILNGYTKGCIK